MNNITAEYTRSGIYSFITNNEGGYLVIKNSEFTNMSNTESGAVINGGYQNSITLVYSSTFKNNYSIYGGVANAEHRSVIKFYDCAISYNFAIQSGVIQASNEGYFEFYRSKIANNYAYTLPIGEVFVVSTNPLISNSTLKSNDILTKSEILSITRS
jgi:hypothetical protein